MSGISVKALIFDMDGVLVNTEPHHVKIERKLFAGLNLNITEEEHSSYMGKATDVMWTEIVHRHNLPYEVSVLSERNKREIIRYFSELKEIELMPGISNILEKLYLKKIPMAVASSSAAETIDIIMSRTGLGKYFLFKVNSGLVSRSKPAPDIFLYTAGLLAVKPEECLVVEDSANGIKAAKAAGMFCVAYTGESPWTLDQSLADECIDDFSQLESVLRKITKEQHF
jgi:HAD superfamily hydrolase (TIGR01509 family)